MFKARFGFAGVGLLSGIVMAAVYAWSHHWLGAIAYLVAGVMAALLIFTGIEILEEPGYQVLGAALVLLSVFSALSTSPATDVDLQRTQNGLMLAMMEASMGQGIRPLSGQERSLAERGTAVCATQGVFDLQQLTTDLYKAERFGPIMTLLDGVSSLAEADKPKGCLDYYYELRKVRPDAFLALESQSPWLKPRK